MAPGGGVWYLYCALPLPRLRRAAVLGLALALGACSGGGPTGARQPFFAFSRIHVQDLIVTPSPSVPGVPTRIRFRLVRSGDLEAPIYWASHLLERPAAGGSLSATSGGPIASGTEIALEYAVGTATTAVITLYPASIGGVATGDGSGDWRSFTVEVGTRR
jgi:hypothetical protein